MIEVIYTGEYYIIFTSVPYTNIDDNYQIFYENRESLIRTSEVNYKLCNFLKKNYPKKHFYTVSLIGATTQKNIAAKIKLEHS